MMGRQEEEEVEEESGEERRMEGEERGESEEAVRAAVEGLSTRDTTAR